MAWTAEPASCELFLPRDLSDKYWKALKTNSPEQITYFSLIINKVLEKKLQRPMINGKAFEWCILFIVGKKIHVGDHLFFIIY